MNPSLTLKDITFSPPRFCAPMAGITHSAFRRLLADYGGCGGLFTEMLAAKCLLRENIRTSPYIRRRPQEPRLIYQLLVSDSDRLDEIVDRVQSWDADGIDINCGCAAPDIRARGAGMALFADCRRLAAVLALVRARYDGLLTVKLRLGRNEPGWEERLGERLQVIEDCGVDAVTIHPRFEDERVKRPARHRLYPWLVSRTRLPVIANGDLHGAEVLAANPDCFQGVAGFMIGRMAVVKPWLFASWGETPEAARDYAAVWLRLQDYINDDFVPVKALKRIQIFTAYFARNYAFGHTLFIAVQNAATPADARERALQFFATNPRRVSVPSLSGI